MFAFVCAVAVHVGAVALCANRAEPPPIICVMPPAIVDVVVDAPDAPPPVDVPIPETPTMPNVENDFQDATPRVQRPARITPIARAPSTHTASFSAFKTSALLAPQPDYPYEARRRHETGSGIATLRIDPASGAVVSAEMEQSIGSAILDQSTLSTFRRWRFRPGTPTRVRVPITFTLMGASF